MLPHITLISSASVAALLNNLRICWRSLVHIELHLCYYIHRPLLLLFTFIYLLLFFFCFFLLGGRFNCRSLTARESTAAAERWRYIQTVLERRRKENVERRERFIRQPLDNILRQRATLTATLSGSKRVAQPLGWDSIVAGRSILKRRALNWRANASRHVHFDTNQQENEAGDNCQEEEEEEITREKLPQLPIVSIPEETEAPSNESSFTNEEDRQRLPLLLMTPSPRLEITTDAQHDPDDDTTHERVSPSGPSWVERQVAKVRQRKLWAFRQQQQQQQQQKLNHHPPRTILKRSVSLLVNVPDEPDTETDSLNEEDEGNRSDSGQTGDDDDDNEHDDDGIFRNNNRQSLAWDVLLGKDEFVEMSGCDQIKDAEATDDPYGGWPHFPVKLAICIQQRQKSLKERTKSGLRKEKEEAATTRSDGKFHPNNSFERRKRFGKRLSIAVVRQRKRRTPKRGPLSSIHQPQARRQSGESRQPAKNADEGHDPAVPANPIPDDAVGQCLTNAIPLQVHDADQLKADAVPEISNSVHKCNEIDSPVASSPISSPSDLISEADVMSQQAGLLEDSSASPESEAETIAADAQDHLDEMIIPAADADSMANKGTDHDEDDDHTAGSAFSPTIRAGQRRRKNITDVTVDDGPYLIDQPEPNVTTAIQPQLDVGMASRPDHIPAAGISPVEQTEFRIASPLGSSSCTGIDNKDSPTGRRLAAYCSGWRPMAIPNQNGGDAIPSLMATVSYWNNFEGPTSEETMAGTINRPEVDVSSDAAAFALTVPAAQKDSNRPPAADSTAITIQTSIDKKTKEARNASKILSPPAVTSTPTQTEPPSGGHGSKEDHRAEEGKCRSDVKESHEEETATECQCLHRAVLTCLLPEAAETLANLELIRRQLKKARIRRQGSGQPSRQPLQVRRDILSTFDPDSSTTN